jgi:enamine deaminase RidA (YjgF/YER057c/UK114 family)
MASKVRYQNPETLSKPPGYSHVVEITTPGRIIYIAGQLGIDRAGNIVGEPGDFRAQAIQAFENLKAALAAAGARFEHLVKVNNYLLDTSHLKIFRVIRDQYLNTKAPPASTTIAITDFARDGALLEIEAIAVLPGAPARATKSKTKKKSTTKTATTAARKAAASRSVKNAKAVRKPSAKVKSSRQKRR